ncbi:hypothetical protein [Nocardia aurantia]|uniref:Uncharacterized protein n=1 Tax=Nocardia aurantia TaxID=2585199 RepID=A0A7K0DN84_9NOCA|nr:hypothetical protein [Nocardia aurantia]MQY27078.1 hypothetical protein [Nocardia aurantia]
MSGQHGAESAFLVVQKGRTMSNEVDARLDQLAEPVGDQDHEEHGHTSTGLPLWLRKSLTYLAHAAGVLVIGVAGELIAVDIVQPMIDDLEHHDPAPTVVNQPSVVPQWDDQDDLDTPDPGCHEPEDLH